MTNLFFKSGMSLYDILASLIIGTLCAGVSWFFLILVIPSAALSAYMERNYVTN